MSVVQRAASLSSGGERLIIAPVRLRWMLIASLLAACVPGPEPVAPTPIRDTSTPCTQEQLDAFDPQREVLERGTLPPMDQATEAHTEELITLPCEEDESDESCLSRTQARAEEAYPQGVVTEAAVGVDREVVRAELVVAGREETVEADSLVDLAEIVSARRTAGEPVVVAHAERVPAPGASRAAVIRLRLPGRSGARRALRAYLVLDAPVNPVRAMLELQMRAAEAQLLVRAVEPQADGTIRVELGCERALEPGETAASLPR